MTEMMKALVKTKPAPGLDLIDIPVPEVGPNDVKIKIHKTAICGTDIHIWDWNEWAQKTIPVPMQVGHEFVGHVVEIGSAVNSHTIKVGTLVSGEGHIVCGSCRNCLAGRRHLCPKTQGVGVNRPGCFAEYLVIPATNVWVADSSLPEELFAIFDPLGNAVHTALQWNMIGEDVLITGAGPIGIMAAAIARHAGARNVVITDINPYRLELAKKMGATHAIDVSKESIDDAAKRIGLREGFDIGLEMSGVPSCLKSMVDNMANGGKISMLGIPSRAPEVDWNKVIFHMLSIRGIYGREMFETWYLMQSMIQSGLNIAPIITHRFDVKDYVQGFEAMKSGKSGKVILDWANVSK